MIESRVLARGPFTPEQVLVRAVETSNQEATPEIEAHIEREWGVLVQDAAEKGKRVWNGITQRVNECDVQGETLRVELAPLDFKHRECVVSYPGYYGLPEAYWRKGAWVAGLVQTSDGWFVHVALSGRSNTTKKENLIGGIVGDEGVVTSGAALFDEMFRELEEEAAAPKEIVTRCALELAFLSPTTNVGFVFSIQLGDTRAMLERRFVVKARDHDIADLVFTPKEAQAETLRRLGSSTAFVADTLLS